MPSWVDHIRPRLASLRLDPAREAEIVEELSLHLDQRYEELRRSGTADNDARSAAISELLDPDTLADHMRTLRQAHPPARVTPGRPGGAFEHVWQDVRYAARTLVTQRAFAAAAVVTLALGIGATTAVFTVVNAVLIKPLPYPDSDALVRIVHNIGGRPQPFFSDEIYLTYRAHMQAIADVGVYTPGATATITGLGDPEEVRALRASRTVLTTLGVQPQLGRWFSPDEDTPRGHAAVIVTSGYWQRRLGGDANVLARTLTIDGEPHQIVGVMPHGFGFSRGDFDVVLPLRISEARPSPIFRLVGVARLKPDVTLAQGNADVSRILDAWFSRTGKMSPVRAEWLPALQPLKADVVGTIGDTLWVLLGAIAIVLLMACANVANLLLVRATSRRQELAVRAALGARAWQVARQLLVESTMLALAGGVLGIALAYAGVRALIAAGPENLPRLTEVAIDPAVLGFALAISLGSGLLFGLAPILKHARPQLGHVLAAGRYASAAPDRQRSQQVLVAAQLAFALVLLVGAGLMIRSFLALRGLDHGFTRPEHVQTFGISILPNIAAQPELVTQMQQELLARVAAVPGVEAAAFTTRVPMGNTRNSSALLRDGDRVDDRITPPNRHTRLVSPGALDVLGTRLVVGRDFTWDDVYNHRLVAILSENLARELWGTPAAAIGKTFREYYDARGPWWEVVGVAGDVHDDGADQPAPTSVYWPAQPGQRIYGISSFQPRRVTIVARSERAGTDGLLTGIREAISAVHPTLPMADVATLDEVYGASLARTSFTLVLLGVAGAMALLLGMAGLYGVITFAVAQRRREIGIRLAMGAQPAQIRGLFVRRGLVLGVAGVAVGLAGAAGAARLLRSLLYGVSPFDPITFGAMTAVLGAVALLASYVPARRALTIDPIETMRAE